MALSPRPGIAVILTGALVGTGLARAVFLQGSCGDFGSPPGARSAYGRATAPQTMKWSGQACLGNSTWS